MTVKARFYREVSVERASPPMSGYRVLLDNRRLKTPAGAYLMLPSSALAEAVADEWRVQEDKIKRESMNLTRLAQTAVDRVSTGRAQFCEQVLAFAGSDLLCYRADTPAELAQRQALAWNPLLDWAKARYGAALITTIGIRVVAQPSDALIKMERAISSHNDFVLVGLHSTAALTGSAVIALALTEGRIDAEQAFEAAALDNIYQAERWGEDAEAKAARSIKQRELMTTGNFFRLLGGR